MSEQFEVQVASYGYDFGAIRMNKETAQKYAEQLVGQQLADLLPGALGQQLRSQGFIPIRMLRVISTRLEDDPANPLQGKVMAVCQEIWRAGPEETK